jgi:quinol monooxygenase YgiN
MVSLGILARMEAKPGKEDEVASFLESALPLVQDEPGTVTWYAFRIGDSEFGIFDTFENEDSRQAHLNGKVAEALMAKADELFASAPDIRPVDLLASK